MAEPPFKMTVIASTVWDLSSVIRIAGDARPFIIRSDLLSQTKGIVNYLFTRVIGDPSTNVNKQALARGLYRHWTLVYLFTDVEGHMHQHLADACPRYGQMTVTDHGTVISGSIIQFLEMADHFDRINLPLAGELIRNNLRLLDLGVDYNGPA